MVSVVVQPHIYICVYIYILLQSSCRAWGWGYRILVSASGKQKRRSDRGLCGVFRWLGGKLKSSSELGLAEDALILPAV